MAIDYIKSNACRICWASEALYAVLPCSHLAYCLDCVTSQHRCVLCRKDVTSVLKLYKS